VSSPSRQDKVAEKYLDRYATAEAGHLKGFPGRYQRAVVIPAFAEPTSFLRQLQTGPLAHPGTLTILVINAPANASRSMVATTRLLADKLSTFGTPAWASHNLDLRQTAPGSGVLSVHRYKDHLRLPDKGGVGLARRIGCDCATRLILDGFVRDSLICNTDADAQLPENYFDAGRRDAVAKVVGVVYPFVHRWPEDQSLALAAQLYELSLHYYVLGLRWAGSPFAFHTVGSTIAIDAPAYARVRGFPKRSGGEDFYLLNKLAKIGTVRCLVEPSVTLQARPSARVPFGTGPAINRIAGFDQPLEQFRIYDPRCFAFIGDWTRQFERLFSDGEHVALDRARERLSERVPAETVREWAEQFDIDSALKHAFKQADSKGAFVRHMHVWFDAFRTLKTIHFLRDRCFPSQPVGEAIGDAPFLSGMTIAGPAALPSAIAELRAQCWDMPRVLGVDADC